MPNHKYWKCFIMIFHIKNKEEFCMEKLGVDTVIVEKIILETKILNAIQNFLDKLKNIFRSFKYSVDFCKVKKVKFKI